MKASFSVVLSLSLVLSIVAIKFVEQGRFPPIIVANPPPPPPIIAVNPPPQPMPNPGLPQPILIDEYPPHSEENPVLKNTIFVGTICWVAFSVMYSLCQATVMPIMIF